MDRSCRNSPTRLAALVQATIILLLLSGCVRAPACIPGSGTPMTLATLYFGRGLPDGGEVDAVSWRRFLAGVVTPAFPDGLTITEATGQWRDPGSGHIGTEKTYVVTVATPAASDLAARLERVRTAYQAEFHQQSVGLTVAPVCASF